MSNAFTSHFARIEQDEINLSSFPSLSEAECVVDRLQGNEIPSLRRDGTMLSG